MVIWHSDECPRSAPGRSLQVIDGAFAPGRWFADQARCPSYKIHGGGIVGMALAGVWGAVLGLFRARTGGLRWSWWAHVATNIVIFGAAVVLAVDQGAL